MGRKKLNKWSRVYRINGVLHNDSGRPIAFPDAVQKDIIRAMANNVYPRNLRILYRKPTRKM